MTTEAQTDAERLTRAYQRRDGRSDQLNDLIYRVYDHPSREADRVFFRVIDEWTPDDRPFWIHKAIMYTNKAVDRPAAVEMLERMLVQAEHYWTLGALLATAATQLGRTAGYPNRTLAQTIEYPRAPTDDIDRMVLKNLRVAAYGAYIATATDFFVGREAAGEFEHQDLLPTVAMAERFIARRQLTHPRPG